MTEGPAAGGAAAAPVACPAALEPRPVRAYIGLGANLGDPRAQLHAALDAIDRLPGTRVAQVSSLYRSAPVGYVDQPDFYNAVAAIDTVLGPDALLEALLGIERQGGRTREFPNAPRLIDLDLLLYGDRQCDLPHLTVPHPRMTDRAFVLLPLAEIAPQCRVPGRGPLPALTAAVHGQAVERLGALTPA